MTPTAKEMTHAEREAAAHRAQRAIAEKSLQQMHEEIAEATAAHDLVVDGWHSHLANALAELTAATEPDPDPQIAALWEQGHKRHAAELKAGKRLTASAFTRDQSIAEAERAHQSRINQP